MTDVWLTPTEASRLFDPPITPSGVKKHDKALQPENTPKGRRYLKSRVLALVDIRRSNPYRNRHWYSGMPSPAPHAPEYPPDVDGRRVCRVCRQAKLLEDFARDRERPKRLCRECDGKRRNEAYYAERDSGETRWKQILKSYGVTREQWEAQWRAQKERCACCETQDPGCSRGWQTEHCHATGNFRGITCQPCNRMLGAARDSIGILRAGIAYLERTR